MVWPGVATPGVATDSGNSNSFRIVSSSVKPYSSVEPSPLAWIVLRQGQATAFYKRQPPLSCCTPTTTTTTTTTASTPPPAVGSSRKAPLSHCLLLQHTSPCRPFPPCPPLWHCLCRPFPLCPPLWHCLPSEGLQMTHHASDSQ
jgi:hypothetical protein